jgi:hypothetical protein
VWSLYLDLEESLGTVETTKAAYDRALEIKVPTTFTPICPTFTTILAYIVTHLA